ncbi:26S proteasome regulatory subunit 8 [Nitzschia inconspicua]|uniref:26S proteasome regulatory subunit 8 n=1 Tax=Nitzschia inconspicua TaxID=303405 RepID=A0A9K3PNB2_9STRA|nr:26S proteasome regulatory subunit 8 [Nitzschia inconspicua]
MEVEPAAKDGLQVQIHPLAIVHMSDQYTRITTGGSPLDKNAPVVGLLFGLQHEDGSSLQVRDADDIPVEISDVTTLQVDLHKAVFPQHNVVGWYRVSVENDEPTAEDLSITRTLQAHFVPNNEPFCFCLLQVKNIVEGDRMKTEDDATDTLNKDLPIHLFELHQVENNSILLGVSNWQLETSEPERIAVERVMKERPSEVDDGSPSQNPYVLEVSTIQTSLKSMKDRVKVLATRLEDMQAGKVPFDPVLVREIQSLVASLGPLAAQAKNGDDEEVQMLAHLAIVGKTMSSLQSYTDKFRVMHESNTLAKEMRHGF